jgi:uncharacterized membrane protein YqiK
MNLELEQNLVFLLIATGGVFLLGLLILIARFYRKVDQGRALIINKMREEPDVTFTGGIVLPIVHRAEVMDISVKTIEIDRRGKDGLICMDNIRADIKVTFFVRVNKTREDVLRVAQAIGCARASDQRTLDELFAAKFSEALKTVGKKLEFEQLYTQRDDFKDQIIQVIGKDLNGYVLDDAAIDYLEQTPLESLDPSNILDARGIRKITEITTRANINTNELKQAERMEIGKQNLISDEAIFRFDQARAEAEAKKEKEILIAQAREQNEGLRVKYEEEKRTHVERQKVEEEVKLAEENKLRAIAVAEQARLREVAIEKVRVHKAHDLEEVNRRREVELGSIEMQKQIEREKKEIADVIRARVAVDKTVAVEEEGIKDLRTEAEATRQKQVTLIDAEARAQAEQVKDIKKAEAEAEAAKSLAKKQLVLAEAALETSDKEARAKIRLAEGIQAEHAAPGLAEVRVKEADAVAVEKQGMAQVAVRQAAVAVTEREGTVEARIIEEKGTAEAAGIRERLLAEVHAKEAEASAIQKRMAAEADGLTRKAEAMKQLDSTSREHEEFRLKLDLTKEVAMESLDARVKMAEQHAAILKEAFDQASFNIVGGDGQFFERFVKAVAVGQSIDGVIDNSDALQHLLRRHLTGNGDVIQDLKDLVVGSGLSSETVKNISVSAVLGKLMLGVDDQTRSKIQLLVDKAQQLGLGDKPPS